MRKLRLALVSSLLVACGGGTPQTPARSAEQVQTPTVATTELSGAGDPIAVAVAGAHRSDKNRARDGFRHPEETLRFFQVQPTQQVIELWPGGGWYTEILAPLLRERGKLSAVVANGPYLQPYKDFLASRPDLYDRVGLVEVTPPTALSLGPDNSADVVLTFRNLHNWMSNGFAAELHAAIYRVLKPGGVYGLVEHRAKPGTSLDASSKSGYVTEEAAIALATAAGFVLEEQSAINANPKDTKDHPNGVWSLPPSLRGGDTDREKFVAIGESDRMTLRFRKPAAGAR